jgi:hypothetical protein
MLVQISWECTPPYPSTGISNLLQPAQTEVVLGQLSTYLASWDDTHLISLTGSRDAAGAGAVLQGTTVTLDLSGRPPKAENEWRR